MAYNLDELEALVTKWAEDRGIMTKSSPSAQFQKTMEEMGELARALMEMYDDVSNLGAFSEVIDGIGDVLVTLIILARLCETDVTTCLNRVYEEIANRKGKMVNGIFVKD